MNTVSKKQTKTGLWLLAIFAVAFLVRSNTFWVPHWQGDQSQYVTLAMKLETLPGLTGYKLQETDVSVIKLGGNPPLEVVYPAYKPGVDGDLISSYRTYGYEYYDTPLYYKAPILPWILKYSHRLFADKDQPFMVVFGNLFHKVLWIRPAIYFKAQFWAVIIPLLFSFGVIALTFFFTRYFFGTTAALFAAWVLAVNPVDIHCSNRIFTEGIMVFSLAIAAWMFYHFFERGKLWGCAASAIPLSIAFLSNQKAYLMLPVFGLYSFLAHPQRSKSFRDPLFWKKIIWNPYFWSCVVITFAMCAWWLLKMYEVFGNPIFQPDTTPDNVNPHFWHLLLSRQPHGTVLYTVGTLAISPPFIFGYAALVPCWQALVNSIKGKDYSKPFLFIALWIMIVSAYLIFRRVGEYRYLYPLYPALAMITGWNLARFSKHFPVYFKKPIYAYAVIGIFLALSATWSVWVAWEAIFNERNLIHAPFYGH